MIAGYQLSDHCMPPVNQQGFTLYVDHGFLMQAIAKFEGSVQRLQVVLEPCRVWQNSNGQSGRLSSCGLLVVAVQPQSIVMYMQLWLLSASCLAHSRLQLTTSTSGTTAFQQTCQGDCLSCAVRHRILYSALSSCLQDALALTSCKRTPADVSAVLQLLQKVPLFAALAVEAQHCIAAHAELQVLSNGVEVPT